MSTFERRSYSMHGIFWHEDAQLCYWQYWVGVRHVWYWCGIPVWTRLKKRHRPVHELVRHALLG
jgi:hypothetical protein